MNFLRFVVEDVFFRLGNMLRKVSRIFDKHFKASVFEKNNKDSTNLNHHNILLPSKSTSHSASKKIILNLLKI